jgi:CubicO group peptidase (beta-lactamase class C family)
MGRLFFVALGGVLFLTAPAWTEERALETQIDRAVADGSLAGLHGVLVHHNGEILVERYFEGEDENWGRPLGNRLLDKDGLHDLRSVTKSIVSLLYGIALGEGKVPGLEKSVIAQFPEYADLQDDPARRKITIRHVLSMTMGTEWNENLPYTDPNNSEIAMEMAADRYRYVLDRPIVFEPGSEWTYNGGATAIIGHLIARGTGMSIDDYAREKLFAPLGIEKFEWARGEDGVPSAASGLRMTIYDLAKIGRLMIDEGRWNGAQVISADWITLATTPQATPDAGIRYGLFWWLAGQGEPPYWAAGFGNGGQRLFYNRRLDLVVTVFAGKYNQPDAWRVPVRIITDIVLPVVLKE